MVPALRNDGRGGVDEDGGAVGEEGGGGRAAEDFGEGGAVESGGVAIEGGCGAGPDAPGDVGDAVFQAASIAARGIAPIVLGDELLDAARLRQGWVARRGGAEGAPSRGDAKLVFGGDGCWFALHAMAHGECDVIFAVRDAGDGGDGAARDDFADEKDAAADFGARFAADIEAEINLVEIRVEGDGEEAEELRFEETEADEADVGFSFMGVELGATRDVEAKESRIGFVIEHQQVAPLGGEEDAVRLAR